MLRQYIANAFLNLRRLKRNKQDKKKTSALRPPGDSESCSIRCRMLEFFKNNFNLQIDNSNQVYIYSPYKPNDDSVMIANVYRKDDNRKPFHLEYFHMLYVSHDEDVVKTINMACSFLKDFCKADMQKLLIVSITEKNTYGLPGIEPFIPAFVDNGLREENIFIRTDVDTAVELGQGDGYWRNPINVNQKNPSFSILYPLHQDGSIADFRNTNDWLEICEASIGEQGKGFGMGVERLEYLFFSKPFPHQNNNLEPNVFINEIQGYNDDYVELYNAGENEANISNFILDDKYNNDTQVFGEKSFTLPKGSIIPSKGFLVFYKGNDDQVAAGTHFKFGIKDEGGETITLVNSNIIIDQLVGPDKNNDDKPFNEGRSYGRFPDGSNNLTLMKPTPGNPNKLE
jgi:hypothetical protein